MFSTPPRWWINPIAAFHEGIISSPSKSITANRHTAFAIVIQDSQEIMTETKEGKLRYQAPAHDRGVFKLMNTMSTSEREAVRVLRSCKLNSSKAPIGGLRYDGLYRVISYGISLTSSPSIARDRWHYEFTLQREPNQDSLEKALAHPIAEELDDWKDYQRVKAAERGKASHRESRRTEAREMREVIVSLHEMIEAVRNGESEEVVGMDKAMHEGSGYSGRAGTKVGKKVVNFE